MIFKVVESSCFEWILPRLASLYIFCLKMFSQRFAFCLLLHALCIPQRAWKGHLQWALQTEIPNTVLNWSGWLLTIMIVLQFCYYSFLFTFPTLCIFFISWVNTRFKPQNHLIFELVLLCILLLYLYFCFFYVTMMFFSVENDEKMMFFMMFSCCRFCGDSKPHYPNSLIHPDCLEDIKKDYQINGTLLT